MKLIKTGVTRWVILTRKYAIKFPRMDYGWRMFIEGIRSNLNEREFYKIAKIPDNQLTKALPYLCPILWASWGGWIVIMPRCTEVETFDPKVRECFLILEKLCGDHKNDNYGYLDGKVVMFDYASTNIDIFEGQKSVIY